MRHYLSRYVYNQDVRRIYLLNSEVPVDNPSGEYIDYGTGTVRYAEIHREWSQSPSLQKRAIRPRNYQSHINILRQPLAWRPIKLSSAAITAESRAAGIYIFSTKITLGSCTVDVILYVGKTTDLVKRMKAYLQIKGGYSSQRPEIAYMFETYKENLQLYFSEVSETKISEIERAIYESVMPEFNLIAPPNIIKEGVP